MTATETTTSTTITVALNNTGTGTITIDDVVRPVSAASLDDAREQVRTIGEETLHNVVTPTIYAEARDLIKAHHEQGHEVIIISASATDLVEPIARELGVDRTVGSQLGIKDGKYTGEVLFYCKGPAKAEAINALAKERNYDLSKSFAYSDSATDLPMLEAVGHAVAVNPDRALKKEALARGWDIRSFKNPEPLFQTRDMGIGAGVVAGIAAVTVGGWWLARRGKPGPA